MIARVFMLLGLLALAAPAAVAQSGNGAPISRGDCNSQDAACACLTLQFERVSVEVRDPSVANGCAEEVVVNFCQYSDRQPQPDAKCEASPIAANGREYFGRINDCNEIVRLFACTRENEAAGRCEIPARVVAINGALEGQR